MKIVNESLNEFFGEKSKFKEMVLNISKSFLTSEDLRAYAKDMDNQRHYSVRDFINEQLGHGEGEEKFNEYGRDIFGEVITEYPEVLNFITQTEGMSEVEIDPETGHYAEPNEDFGQIFEILKNQLNFDFEGENGVAKKVLYDSKKQIGVTELSENLWFYKPVGKYSIKGKPSNSLYGKN